MKRFILILSIFPIFIAGFEIPKTFVYTGMSAVFPGWGLINAGQCKTGAVFISSEAVLLGTAFSFYSISNRQEENADDYGSYILSKNISSYSDFVKLKMESYISSDEYNLGLISKARNIYPDDIGKQDDYIENNSIPDSLSWDWKDESFMDKFYSYRTDAKKYNELFSYSATAIIINHVASSIFTFLKTKELLKTEMKVEGYYFPGNYMIDIGVKF